MRLRRSLLAWAAAVALGAAASASAATSVPLHRLGAGAPLASGAAATTTSGGLETFEVPEFDVVNRKIPNSGISAARVPAAHVPTPSGSAVVGATGFGFDGLSHLDQRLAGAGNFANTQFSLEPPDQALCVGNGFVVESVNTALRVRSTAGTIVAAAVPLNQFFGLAPEVVRSAPPVFGDFTSDPKCYYDAPTQRFFLTLLQADVVSTTGDFTGRTSVRIAVSNSNDPTGGWTFYSLDTTNNGANGIPSHSGCPCLGDQPLIGADANGFYVSTNEFPFFAPGFNGAQVYAMSKAALVSGSAASAVMIDTGAIPAPDGGIWYTLQPATTPPGGTYEAAGGGTEYFMSALDFNAKLDNRIAVWALTGTASLATATPNVTLTHVVVDSQVYGQPPDAQQRPGSTPLGDSVSPREKLELIAGNDDRMNQVTYAGGKLWGAVNTVVKTPNGPTRVGIAYFVASPSMTGGSLTAAMSAQGYVAVNQQNVLYPSIGINAAGTGAMGFTLVGPGIYPSTAYVTLDAAGHTGGVRLAAAGAGPEDGFTGYKLGGADGRTARWGDYSAAAVDESGDVWLAAEYIPNSPRTAFANWGTYVIKAAP